MPALQREAAWAEERLFGDLRQSVPQNGRVHLHIIELCLYKVFREPFGSWTSAPKIVDVRTTNGALLNST